MKNSLNIWKLFGILIVYSMVSFIVLIFTSGGWAVLGVAILGLIGYGLFSLVALIISIVKIVKNRRDIIFNTKLVPFILLSQIAALAFNIGDCGDASGSYAFWQRLVYGFKAFCEPNPGANTDLSMFLFLSFLIIYAILLLIFFTTIRSARDASI